MDLDLSHQLGEEWIIVVHLVEEGVGVVGVVDEADVVDLEVEGALAVVAHSHREVPHPVQEGVLLLVLYPPLTRQQELGQRDLQDGGGMHKHNFLNFICIYFHNNKFITILYNNNMI